MRRFLALVLFPALLAAGPADAAGLGFSLPKLRVLSLDGATSYGASVQVIAGSFSLGLAKIDLALDYAYTRDFALGNNYSFFDGTIGVGVPLALTPAIFLTPSLDLHALPFVASPQNVLTPLYGAGPRLTVGFHPSANVSVELGVGYDVVLSRGGIGTLEIGGTYNF